MRNIIYLLAVAVLASCISHEKPNTLIVNYSDFGPQVIASEIIGMEWWQWQSHGDSSPTEYPIKVVVYRDISLTAVKSEYPVIKAEKQDFRYLTHQDALQYLDEKIEENLMEEVTLQLQQTRLKIIDKLGDT